MTTDVIVRADDIGGPTLMNFSSWLVDAYPKIPISAFLWQTDRWLPRHWDRAATLIRRFDWEVGGHTRRHPMLPLVESDAEIHDIVRTNIRDIETGLSSAGLEYSVVSFAYPFGAYDERVVSVLQELGIEHGLTYPDGFPYRSVSAVPTGHERYSWGVTHNAQFDVEVWNDRFDRVYRGDGLYVLCLHPPLDPHPSMASLYRTILGSDDLSVEPRSVWGTGRMLWRWWRFTEWEWYPKLRQHLDYVTSHDDVNLTTYRAVTG